MYVKPRIQHQVPVMMTWHCIAHCCAYCIRGNVVSLWRSCVTTELVSLEESARTQVVLDVDGYDRKNGLLN